ncbi:hypothetical protein HU200_061469 [Digitaria exilis]|uniref:AP2/ERF domain-containing protein n=1 Tax=Digitaria exilis TaxID=1010633 RepID=A0A835A4S2_9POAL|nr:hypothetical protein HU200_061469 [Digitaria exilis]
MIGEDGEEAGGGSTRRRYETRRATVSAVWIGTFDTAARPPRWPTHQAAYSMRGGAAVLNFPVKARGGVAARTGAHRRGLAGDGAQAAALHPQALAQEQEGCRCQGKSLVAMARQAEAGCGFEFVCVLKLEDLGADYFGAAARVIR